MKISNDNPCERIDMKNQRHAFGPNASPKRDVHPWHSIDYIKEHAYLVARGVRPLAIVDHLKAEAEIMLRAATDLEIASVGDDVVPFVVRRRDGIADCGFAAARWVVDLYQWLVGSDAVPKEHEHRIRGLLLGYSVDAIQAHDERASGRRFSELDEPASNSLVSYK
jgi:hypothetical protein